MKKTTKMFLTKCVLILLSIVIIGVSIINKTSIGDTTLVRAKLRSEDDNIISFDSGFFKDYVHIMLKMSLSENIENGLKFDVINPKGENIDNGILYDGEEFNEAYKGMAGEWKIILYFEDNNSSARVASGFSSTSKKDRNMSVEDGVRSDSN